MRARDVGAAGQTPGHKVEIRRRSLLLADFAQRATTSCSLTASPKQAHLWAALYLPQPRQETRRGKFKRRRTSVNSRLSFFCCLSSLPWSVPLSLPPFFCFVNSCTNTDKQAAAGNASLAPLFSAAGARRFGEPLGSAKVSSRTR